MNEPIETLLPNPALKPEDLDKIDQSFLEAAALVDRGQDIPADLLGKTEESTKPAESEVSEPVKSTESTTDDVSTTAERPRDPITGKFIKTDKEIAAEKGQSEAVDAPKTALESEYALAQRTKKEKEQARLDKSWENVNQIKDEIKQRETELARREQQLKEPQPQKRQKMLTEDGQEITSRMLYNAARDFRKQARKALEDGNYDGFNEQDKFAEEAEKSGQQLYQVETEEARQDSFNQHKTVWEGHMRDAIKAEPDLANPATELSKQVAQVLEQNDKDLWMFQDGFKKAVEIARLRIAAADAPLLLEANKKLKAENDRLTALTSIKGSSPTAPAPVATTDVMNMTEAESDAHFTRLAQKADGY